MSQNKARLVKSCKVAFDVATRKERNRDSPVWRSYSSVPCSVALNSLACSLALKGHPPASSHWSPQQGFLSSGSCRHYPTLSTLQRGSRTLTEFTLFWGDWLSPIPVTVPQQTILSKKQTPRSPNSSLPVSGDLLAEQFLAPALGRSLKCVMGWITIGTE